MRIFFLVKIGSLVAWLPWLHWLPSYNSFTFCPIMSHIYVYPTPAHRGTPPCTLSQHPDTRETGDSNVLVSHYLVAKSWNDRSFNIIGRSTLFPNIYHFRNFWTWHIEGKLQQSNLIISPNIWHKNQDRIKNVELYTDLRNCALPPQGPTGLKDNI